MLSLQVGELCKENALVKGQIVALEETVSVHEMEAEASRETIVRLASEVNREQKKAASCTEEKDKLNQVPYVECVCMCICDHVYEAETGNQMRRSTWCHRPQFPAGAGGSWGLTDLIRTLDAIFFFLN